MSNTAITWVWDHSQATSDERLLLLALSDTADDGGRGKLPDYDVLIRRCKFPDARALRESLFVLMDYGELDVGESGPDDEVWFTILPLAGVTA